MTQILRHTSCLRMTGSTGLAGSTGMADSRTIRLRSIFLRSRLLCATAGQTVTQTPGRAFPWMEAGFRPGRHRKGHFRGWKLDFNRADTRKGVSVDGGWISAGQTPGRAFPWMETGFQPGRHQEGHFRGWRLDFSRTDTGMERSTGMPCSRTIRLRSIFLRSRLLCAAAGQDT